LPSPLDIRDDSEPLERVELRAWAPLSPRLQFRAFDDPWKDEPPPDRALGDRFDDEPLWNEPRDDEPP
jgi:hypothetical protein